MAKRWYVVHVYSGFEKKIAQQIKEQAAQKGLADQFEEVLVPSEEVVEVRRGQKVNAERKFFPGYVLVKMDLTDDAWHLVKNTPKVTGFLGTKTRPSPISEAEAERIMKQTQEGVERPRPSVLFEIGEQVRVADGPFTSFNGTVEEVDEEKGRVKVSVSIFGRSTPGRTGIRPGREGLIHDGGPTWRSEPPLRPPRRPASALDQAPAASGKAGSRRGVLRRKPRNAAPDLRRAGPVRRHPCRTRGIGSARSHPGASQLSSGVNEVDRLLPPRRFGRGPSPPATSANRDRSGR